MDRSLINNRIQLTLFSFISYFCCSFFIQMTGFLKFYSFVGLKSFMPVTYGLLFGLYGIIGEIMGATLSNSILHISISFTIMEYIIIIVPGLLSWILWHINSYTHKIHFRFFLNYVRYFIIVFFSFLICALISRYLINEYAMSEIMVWGISMSLLLGIPIDIIYGGLMCFNPVLPPLKVNGKIIVINDDIRDFLQKDTSTLEALNEKLEDFGNKNNIKMKRLFEIQNIIEEIYLRIINNVKMPMIDVRISFDITFSIELIYIGKKYNPFYVNKTEDALDIAGLTLIKHRALLASFSYMFGENQIHVVI